MNLADYLSELLEENTEVSVPGLGYFVREHVGAAYNEARACFYPPHHTIRFVAETRNDDVLTAYIARQKDISIASSKYFAEKFVNKLHEEAAGGRQLFSNLGTFTYQQNQLVFEPNAALPNDPEFYGLPVVNITKLSAAPASGVLTPGPSSPVIPQAMPLTAVTENTTTQPPITEAPAYEPPVVPQPKAAEARERDSNAISAWVVIMAALLFLGVAAYIVNSANPNFFKNLFGNKPVKHQVIVTAPPEVHRDLIKDSTAKVPPGADTITQNAALPAVIDTAKVPHWELIIAKFYKTSPAKAQAAVKHFRAIGIDAKIVNDVPGNMIKVSGGTFLSIASADSVRNALLKAGKINKNQEIIKAITKK